MKPSPKGRGRTRRNAPSWGEGLQASDRVRHCEERKRVSVIARSASDEAIQNHDVSPFRVSLQHVVPGLLRSARNDERLVIARSASDEAIQNHEASPFRASGTHACLDCFAPLAMTSSVIARSASDEAIQNHGPHRFARPATRGPGLLRSARNDEQPSSRGVRATKLSIVTATRDPPAPARPARTHHPGTARRRPCRRSPSGRSRLPARASRA